MAPNRGSVEVSRRDRFALVGELVNDVSHECNNQLAFVLSNLQNLAEYSDELAQIVAAYRERVKSAGLRDPELARLEDEMDLQFLLEDAGRAAREGLEGASRLRDVLRTLSRLGAEEGGEPQLIDLAKAVRQAASFETKTIGLHAQLTLSVIEEAPAFVSASIITRAIVVLIKDAVACFGRSGPAQNRMHIVLERDGERYAIRIEHNGKEPGTGLAIADEAARLVGGELVVEPGRVSLYVPQPEP